ncbi:hypothetical protein FQN60_011294 [Etheostoma spectabile]|uniref:Uncharacterized protein n=1 Tax=Etheostoma spectabile TaxID=54343 RepID=A0A5J5DS23_9PERO|nr:hypothetical protein FQN60_011294 [Etheostoma spectabile]
MMTIPRPQTTGSEYRLKPSSTAQNINCYTCIAQQANEKPNDANANDTDDYGGHALWVMKLKKVDKTVSAALTQTSRAGIGVQDFKWIIARRKECVFYLEEVNRYPLIPPKVDSATEIGITQENIPRSFSPNIWTSPTTMMSTRARSFPTVKTSWILVAQRTLEQFTQIAILYDILKRGADTDGGEESGGDERRQAVLEGRLQDVIGKGERDDSKRGRIHDEDGTP